MLIGLPDGPNTALAGKRPGVSLHSALGAGLLLLALMLLLPASSEAQDGAADVCSQGVVGRIVIDNQPVFPAAEDDPKLIRMAFGAANLLHVETTRSFLRRELLFHEGDCFDPFLLSESRRLLEQYGFIDQVSIEAVDDGPGVKAIEVRTRDRWSTQVDLGLTYDDGLHLERFQATENNFLGNGIKAEVTRRARRETRDWKVGLFTPRFFGTTDADINMGETRAGRFLYQRLNHGFVGETTRFSASEIMQQETSFYSYSTGGTEAFSHVLVPMRRDRAELAAAVRLGDPGRSWIAGLSVERLIQRRDGPPELVTADDFEGSTPTGTDLPSVIARQTGAEGATRLAVHLGTRRFRYEEYVGLDGIRDRSIVALGFFSGISIGRSLGILMPGDVVDTNDTYGRIYSTFTVPLGSSVLHFATSGEGVRSRGSWRDLLAQADVALWGRAGWLPDQTVFLRASAGGGWQTELPFQLSLGGREGVRSLRDDEHPGGRRMYLVAEDRIRFPWPRWRSLELGASVFADAGRTWAGDVPFGSDLGWVGSVGFGLRIAFPAGSRNILRPDIAFPLGHSGSPVFRITAEVNRIRFLFKTPRWLGSRRFLRGPEEF